MKRDDRVRHQAVPDWGVGRVLEDPAAGKVRIFFSNVGVKTISLLAKIVIVKGADAINPILDNLKIGFPGQESSYKTLTVLKQQFLNEFPGGFHGEKYDLAERNYKVEAYELAKKLLRRATFEKALSAKRFDELCDKSKKVIQATNLVFSNEKMNFIDGLRKVPFQQTFCECFYGLLFGDDALERRFTSFCGAWSKLVRQDGQLLLTSLLLCIPTSTCF